MRAKREFIFMSFRVKIALKPALGFGFVINKQPFGMNLIMIIFKAVLITDTIKQYCYFK